MVWGDWGFNLLMIQYPSIHILNPPLPTILVQLTGNISLSMLSGKFDSRLTRPSTLLPKMRIIIVARKIVRTNVNCCWMEWKWRMGDLVELFCSGFDRILECIIFWVSCWIGTNLKIVVNLLKKLFGQFGTFFNEFKSRNI